MNHLFLGMRLVVPVMLLAFAFSGYASEPIYYHPSLIRGFQKEWLAKELGTPNASVELIGPFGIHAIAPIRIGWEPFDCLDSAHGFSMAETLWLDYYCAFKDSTLADLSLIYGPATVQRMPSEERERTSSELEWSKSSPKSQWREKYRPVVSTSAKEVVGDPLDLAHIPKFTSYTVKAGDSLWRIHQKMPQFTIKQLMEANGGKERIYVGQVLQIPH